MMGLVSGIALLNRGPIRKLIPAAAAPSLPQVCRKFAARPNKDHLDRNCPFVAQFACLMPSTSLRLADTIYLRNIRAEDMTEPICDKCQR